MNKTHLFNTCSTPRDRKSYFSIMAFKNVTCVSHITVRPCNISHVIEVKARRTDAINRPQSDTLLNINWLQTVTCICLAVRSSTVIMCFLHFE